MSEMPVREDYVPVYSKYWYTGTKNTGKPKLRFGGRPHKSEMLSKSVPFNIFKAKLLLRATTSILQRFSYYLHFRLS